MPEVRRLDMMLMPKMRKTPEGFLEGEAIVTRTGIFNYQNPDGTIRRELRHPNDVFKASSLDSLRMMPIVSPHPKEIFVTADNAKELQIGQTGENFKVDGELIMLPIKITHADIVKRVENGLRDLSLGYTVEHAELDGGNWEGQHYDLRQTNIRYNHLAIVPEGRAGVARLNLDSTDAILSGTKLDNKDNQNLEGGSVMVKITLDGIQYDAAPEVVKAFEKAQAQTNENQKRIDALILLTVDEKPVGKCEPLVMDSYQKLVGERDTLKKKLDETEKKLNPESIQKAVNERIKIIDNAKKVLDDEMVKKLDGMTNLQIMKETIIHANTDKAIQEATTSAMKDAQEPYVQGCYDIIVATLPAQKIDAIARQRETVTHRVVTDEKGKPISIEDARDKMIHRMVEGYKKPVVQATVQ